MLKQQTEAENIECIERPAMTGWDNCILTSSYLTVAELGHLRRFREEGMAGITLFLEADFTSVKSVRRNLNFLTEWIFDNKDHYCLIRSRNDLVLAKEQGKLGIVVGLNSAGVLREKEQSHGENYLSIDLAREFYRRGIRVLSLVSIRSNCLFKGSADFTDSLDKAPQSFISTLWGLGFILELSGANALARDFALSLAPARCMFASVNIADLHPHVCNLSVSILQSIATTGTLVCFSGLAKRIGCLEVTNHQLINHIFHYHNTVGEGQLALGSGRLLSPEHYCLPQSPVNGFGQARRTRGWRKRILEAKQLRSLKTDLLERGCTIEKVEHFWGGSTQKFLYAAL